MIGGALKLARICKLVLQKLLRLKGKTFAVFALFVKLHELNRKTLKLFFDAFFELFKLSAAKGVHARSLFAADIC